MPILISMTMPARRAFILATAAALALLPSKKIFSSPSSPSSPSSAAPSPGPGRPADVASPEAIVAAVYDVISGPAGRPRDWGRFRSLFAAGARLVPTGPLPGGGFGPRVLDPDGYVARTTPIFETSGFYEKEVARRVERFGHIVHVFSTYEARHDPADAQPFLRGINSFQLVFDGVRWWVVTVFWEAESDTVKIPPEYLRSSAPPAP